jgi:hypothetical protein
VDAELALASVNRTVIVEAIAPQVQRDSAARESVIETRQILDLPLDGRNILDLVYLSPGADKNVTNAGLGDFASNGNRPNGNSFLIDGASNRDEIRGQSGLSVSVDAVEQFKLKNSNATAEYGGAGTQMAVIVKSGSNQLHGSLFVVRWRRRAASSAGPANCPISCATSTAAPWAVPSGVTRPSSSSTTKGKIWPPPYRLSIPFQPRRCARATSPVCTTPPDG